MTNRKDHDMEFLFGAAFGAAGYWAWVKWGAAKVAKLEAKLEAKIGPLPPT